MAEPHSNDVITADVACVRCGYSLKGRPNQGRCPECGTSVRSSTSPLRLFVGRRRWHDHVLWLVVVGGAAAAFVALIIAWALDESVVFTISLRVAQVAWLVALLGSPFSRYLRRSRAVWVAALMALGTAVVAGLAA